LPGYIYLLADSSAGLLVPVLKLIGTVDPAGLTLIYPCISWCSAEQKSVQYIGNTPVRSGFQARVDVSPGMISSSALLAPFTAKPCGTSQSCSRLVIWKYTSSPNFTPSMLSGAKWLRMEVAYTCTLFPSRTTLASFSPFAAQGLAF